ncbi:MAG: LamG domain-containing protein, partial [Lentisphaeria bacterium]|nr:LamG domain-containing protein [Lentisphaeria bacterium]
MTHPMFRHIMPRLFSFARLGRRASFFPPACKLTSDLGPRTSALRAPCSALLAFFLLASGSALHAEETRSWPFDIPGDYSLFRQSGAGEPGDAQKQIEIADGQARLVPTTFFVNDDTVTEFNKGTYTGTVAGGRGVLSLTESGGLFPVSGVFTSRELDGGTDPNQWKQVIIKTSVTELPAAYSLGIDAGDDIWGDLEYLFHFDSDFTDATGQTVMTISSGSPSITTGRIGSGALAINQGTLTQNYGQAGQKIDEMTISFWLRTAQTGASTYTLCNSGKFSYWELHNTNGKLDFRAYTSAYGTQRVFSTGGIGDNQWHNVAVTYTAATGQATMYIDGEIDSVHSLFPAGTQIGTGANVLNTTWGGNTTVAFIDEAFYMQRALTKDEIQAILDKNAYRGRLRVKSWNTATERDARNFSGPDGTGSTFYSTLAPNLVDTSDFQLTDRYVQYQLTLLANPTRTVSPIVSSVGFVGTTSRSYDFTVGDFADGAFSGVSLLRSELEPDFLGLNKQATGAFRSLGSYTSKTFDGAAGAIWENLQWTPVVSWHLPASEAGLVGLWYFDNDWTTEVGSANGGAVGDAGFTAVPKVGEGAAVFDGTGDSVSFGSPSLGLNDVITAMFWVKPAKDGGYILKQGWDDTGGGRGWAIYYGRAESWQSPYSITWASGDGTGTDLRDAMVSTPLGSVPAGGWTHVTVVKDSEEVSIYVNAKLAARGALAGNTISYASNALTGGDTFAGALDELALFSGRALSAPEIEYFYNLQSKSFGIGAIQFQCRVGDFLPLSGDFVGPDGTADTYFTSAGGNNLTAVPGGLNGRYLQFRAGLVGFGGETSPGIRNVTLTYNGGSTFGVSGSDGFDDGTYDNDTVKWYADQIRLADLSAAGAAPSAPGERGQAALFHLDDSTAEANGAISTVDAVVGFDPDSRFGTHAALFDGATTYFQINSANAAGVGKADFTVMLWFKTSAAAPGDLFSRGTVGGGGNPFVRLGIDAATGGLLVESDQIAASAPIGEEFNNGAWHHVAMVREGARMKLYADGVQVYERVGTDTPYDSVNPWLTFGAVWTDVGQSNFFNGLIDEVVVYDRSLAFDEIGSVYGNAPRYVGPAYQNYTSGEFQHINPIGWVNLAWGEGDPGYSNAIPGGADGLPFSGGESGLVSLHHLDVKPFADSVGVYGGTEEGGIVGVDTSLQKLGDGCAVFDGGAALSLTGSGGAADFALGANGLSFSVWVRWDGGAPVGVVPVLSNNDGGVYYALRMTADGRPELTLNDGAPVTLTGTRLISDGVWHQIVCVVTSGAQAAMYVDGAKDVTVTVGVPSAISPAGATYIGQDGSAGAAGLKWRGLIDELALFQTALTPSDIYQRYTDQTGNLGLAALWHLDDLAGTGVTETFSGTVGTFNGAYGAPGKFDQALDFSDSLSNRVNISHFDGLDVSSLTISLWIKPTGSFNGANATIVGRTGGEGVAPYRVRMFGDFSTALGLQILKANGSHGSANIYIPGNVTVNEWNHLAFTYDASTGLITSYANGRVVAVEETGPGGLIIDPAEGFEMMGTTGSGYVGGTLDEVAIFGRALANTEVLNLYNRGVASMRFQVAVEQTAGQPPVWTGADGTAGDYIITTPSALELGGIYKFFRYQLEMATEDPSITPVVDGVQITKALYPAGGPYVVNKIGQAYTGYLWNFQQELGPDPQVGGEVRYRVSVVPDDAVEPNPVNWYYWDGNSWDDSALVGEADYTYDLYTNSASEISANIWRFYDEKGPGTFFFQAFLVSNGSVVVELDTVTLNYASGKATVTMPNGAEQWWIGQPYDIEWDVEMQATTGKPRPEQWNIYYSTPNPADDPLNLDDDVIWTAIATNVTVTPDGAGHYVYNWTIPVEIAAQAAPAGPSEQFRIRVEAAADLSLYDDSDADNDALLPLYDLTFPTAGVTVLTGNLYDITWTYADSDVRVVPDTRVKIEYSLDAGATWIICEQDVDRDGIIDGDASDVPAETALNSNTGLFENWKVPSTLPAGVVAPAAAPMLVRVTDKRTGYETLIYEISDSFDLKDGFDVFRPDGDDAVHDDNVVYSGFEEPIKWLASSGSGSVATAEYTIDATVGSPVYKPCTAPDIPPIGTPDFMSGMPNKPGQLNEPTGAPGDPDYIPPWAVPEVTRAAMMNGSFIYSYKAKVKVFSAFFPPANDVSRDVFTIAGMTVMAPAPSQKLQSGVVETLKWVTVGAPDADTVTIQARQSLDGGATWGAWTTVKDIDGNPADAVLNPNTDLDQWAGGLPDPATWDGKVNTFDWYIDPATFELTPDTEIRIVSNTDPNTIDLDNAKLTKTVPAQVAGMQFVQPVADALWQVRKQRDLVWVASGVDDNLVLYYAISDVPFTEEEAVWKLYTDTNGDTVIIANDINEIGNQTFTLTVPDDPARFVRLKLSENNDPTIDLYAVSDLLVFPGARIDRPVENYAWEITSTELVEWTSAYTTSIPTQDFLRFEYTLDAYSGGAATWYVGVSGYPFAGGSLSFTPAIFYGSATKDMRPTPSAKVRIIAEYPPDIDGDGATTDERIDAESPVFTIAGVFVESPASTDQWTLGDSKKITWYAAGSGDDLADVYYSVTGNFDDTVLIGSFTNNEIDFNQSNRTWNIPADLVPSQTAKVRVVVDGPDGTYQDDSESFTLRGLTVTKPLAGAVLTQGTNATIEWVSAGLLNDPAATVDIYYTPTGDPADEVLLKAEVAIDTGVADGKGSYTWTVDPYVTAPSAPDGGTIEPKFRVVVVSADTGNPGDGGNGDAIADNGYEARSQIVTVKGIRIDNPVAGGTYAHGDSLQIQWTQAAAGTTLNLYYSPDGAFDPLNPGTPLNGGTPLNITAGTFDWTIQPDVIPADGTGVIIALSDTTLQTASKAFSVQGITVTQPTATSLWAVGSEGVIRWDAAGNGNLEIVLIVNGTPQAPLVTGLPATDREYIWDPITDVSGGAAYPLDIQVVVREVDQVTPPVYAGTSEAFQLFNTPQIGVSKPGAGELLGIGTYYRITWAKAGVVTGAETWQVTCELAGSGAPVTQIYPTDPGDPTAGINVSTNLAYEWDYNPGTNLFTIDWFVPDLIAGGDYNYTITVRETTDGLEDTTPAFVVGPRFELSFPNGGETLYTNSAVDVTWSTYGTAGHVEFAYSTDAPLYQNWTVIEPVYADAGDGFTITANEPYPWTVPILESNLVKFRVRHVNADGSDATGAKVISAQPFEIRNYDITWKIVDDLTGTELDNLAVNDSSGWAAVGLTSPVLREYAFGSYTTTWIREGYFDKTVLNWQANADKEIEVRMIQSQTDFEYHVMGNFDYDTKDGADMFRINTWLERGGKILDAPTSTTVTIYDEAGTVVAGTPLTKTPPDATGVFWLTWNPTNLDRAKVYFAKVDVTYNAAVYSSGVAYSLRVPVAQEEIRTGVAGLRTAVGVPGDTSALPAVSGGNTPDSLHAKVDDLAADLDDVVDAVVSKTGVDADGDGREDVVNLAESLLGDPADAADAGLIGAIRDDIAAVKADTAGISSTIGSGFSIVSRNKAVKTGTTVTIRVKSTTGIGSQIAVNVYKPTTGPGAGISNYDPIFGTVGMTEVGTTGIYELDLPLLYDDDTDAGTPDVAWPVGEYMVEVVRTSDTVRDSMVLTVTNVDVDTLYADVKPETDKIQSILTDTGIIEGLVSSNLDVAVSSRASQLSVDGIVTETAKIQDILDDTSAMQPLVDVAVSSRASQLSVDGIVTEAAKIQDILDDTSAMQPLVDVAVSSRASQLSVDGLVTEAAKIQDILDDTSAMQPLVDVAVSSRASQLSVDG